MNKIFIILIFLFLSLIIFADQGDFINQLSEKKYASFEDCVISFCYLYELKVDKEFDKNIETIKTKIKYFPKKYTKDKDLTIGDFSLFAIQYLDIKSGIFYMASKTGRYASRELMLLDIIPSNTSEFKKISGQELISLFHKVVEYADSKKVK